MKIFEQNVGELIPGLPGEQSNTPQDSDPKLDQTPEQNQDADAQPEEPKSQEPIQQDVPVYDPVIQSLLDAYSGNAEVDVESLLQSELERVRLTKMDFSSMQDEEVIRMQLKKEWPELSGNAFERAVSKYFNSQFGEEPEGDEDDEDYVSEKQIRDAQIRRRANEVRKALAEEQSKVKRKTPEELKAEYQAKQLEAQKKAEQDMKAWQEMVTGNSFVSKVLKAGEIEVGKPDQPVSYKVGDVEKYKAALTSDPAFFELFSTGDKNNPVDLEKWAKVVAYAMNPSGFEALLHSSGKNLATGKLLDELENPAKPGEVKPAQASSFADALMGAISKRR